ncbi:hypothetical protein AVEN_222578-1 [Araneus ventricosus]|uniref:Uncharacterized protein n=1 Tax=Araneus ventricosus TaxID=182803 RepID=A0A4Y2JJ71_ARAVE|nr:hypothetical protein AVEN_222578-1 [Araneus ventricosus]
MNPFRAAQPHNAANDLVTNLKQVSAAENGKEILKYQFQQERPKLLTGTLNSLSEIDNECADQLAKEAITKDDPFFLPKPLSYLKSEIWSAALSIWQDNWDNGETGRSTHDIVPRVSSKPVGWNIEELMEDLALPFIPSSPQSSNTWQLLVRRKRISNALCHKMSVYPLLASPYPYSVT